MSAFLLKDPDCVLIHIPKSAGTSIRRGVWKGNYDGPVFGPLPKQFDVYFKFAFVRNPFDRLLSIWRMFSGGTSETVSKDVGWTPNPALTVNDILDIVCDERVIYDERRSSFEERIKHHAIPMTHEFNALSEADFIGRYETIDKDWGKVCRRVGLATRPLPRKHFTSQTVIRTIPILIVRSSTGLKECMRRSASIWVFVLRSSWSRILEQRGL